MSFANEMLRCHAVDASNIKPGVLLESKTPTRLADISTPEKLDLAGSVALNCSKSIGCLLVTHFQCPRRSAEVPAVQNPEDVYPPEFEDKLSILDRVVLSVGQTKRDLEEYGLGVPYRDPKKYGLGVGGLI